MGNRFGSGDDIRLELMRRTYCNPLPLPDYPRGRATYEKRAGAWTSPERNDFRETADPSVLFHDGKWYLYPSCGMGYWTEDFVTWRHRRMAPYDAGYAPTIVVFRGRFLLTACGAPVLAADNPLGPFTSIGNLTRADGSPFKGWDDPMLFADEDGRLYAYWGCGRPGIFGAALDPDRPNHLTTEPKMLFSYDPAHVWERFGDFNEDFSKSWVEGAWMLKDRGTYYLTYAAPGTEFKSYGMGTYVSKSPLGPFTYAKRNPILRDTEGLVHGPGHGCLVRGPRDTLWAFYTHLVRNSHDCERRCGMDPAGFDDEGNLFVLGASETPQWAPGVQERPEFSGNDTGLVPVNINKGALSSSVAPGRAAFYAVDNVMRTWWEAAPEDAEPWLVSDFRGRFTVCAARILWAEPGLDYASGVVPGPFRYRIEVSDGDAPWRTVLDRTDNGEDLLIDYRVFEPAAATRARLTITGRPKGIRAGVISFGLFGLCSPKGAY